MSPRSTADDRRRSVRDRILKAHPELLAQLDALEAYTREVEDAVIADSLRAAARSADFSLHDIGEDVLDRIANQVENFRR